MTPNSERCDGVFARTQSAGKCDGTLKTAPELFQESESYRLAHKTNSQLSWFPCHKGRHLLDGSMVHGGPVPATSDGRSTSVGSLAIERFLRPVCYQDFPDALLPVPLRRDIVALRPHRMDGLSVSGSPVRHPFGR